MSDYMFMLESHLTGPQNKALAQVMAVAQQAGLNVYLTGGSMRDVMGGFAARDLDIVVEGQVSKLVKALQKEGAELVATDELLKSSEMRLLGNVPVGISMSRQERYARSGAKPQISPAPIHEHLRCRDFTINAIALSLSKGSRGLLIDPTNGVSDLQLRELRTVGNYTLYDDPSRLLRLLRLEVRLGFAIGERTMAQYRNAREAGLEAHITPAARRQELLAMAAEPNPGELIKRLEQEGLLTLFAPALSGAKVNHAGFQKLHKAAQSVPYGHDFEFDPRGLFLFLLTELLTPKERAALIQASALEKADTDLWQKLETRAKKLEKALQAPKLSRASQIYAALRAVPGDEILFLLCRSTHRLVTDRLKNYLQKYLQTAQEVTDADVVAKGGVPGTPKFDVIRNQIVNGRLDGRLKKPAPVVVEVAPVAVASARRFN